ncbi:MAG: SDR family NAD(P)-dependent oxidoreductase [Dongiaceae bacterium]
MSESSRKAAIVTGSATGIGAAIATTLAASGWNVLINYTKSAAEAKATAEACRRAGADVVLARGNVARDADCRRLVATALKRWGRLDGLVNNAGVTKFVKRGNLEGLTAKDFERIFAINLVGAYQMSRAAAAPLARSEHGSIVNISSHGAFTGLGSSIAYATSKGALNTLTLALARELAPRVRVNALCPGFVDTRWTKGRMSAAGYAAFRRRIQAMTPLGRMVEPADVAEAALWLLNGARAVTGQLIVIDSGNHLTINTPLKSRGRR